MARITEAMLDKLGERLNKETNSPLVPYVQDEKGRSHPQPGCYLLDYAYGGVCLRRLLPSGGESNVLSIGYVKKSELYPLIHAYLRGIEEGRALPPSGMEG